MKLARVLKMMATSTFLVLVLLRLNVLAQDADEVEKPAKKTTAKISDVEKLEPPPAPKKPEAKKPEAKASTKPVAKPSAKPSAKQGAKPAAKPVAKPPADSDDRATIDPKILDFIKPVTTDDDDDELLKKMKERHNVAVKLFEARVEDYQRNFGNLALVLDAARQALDAKLDLSADRDQQLAVYEQALEAARLIEQHFEKLSEAGVGSQSDLQRSKLARVTVEVQILKLKREAAAP